MSPRPITLDGTPPVKVTVYLSEAQAAKLDDLCAREDRSRSSMMRHLLDQAAPA